MPGSRKWQVLRTVATRVSVRQRAARAEAGTKTREYSMLTIPRSNPATT
jgi:hypothetical protein